MVTTWLFFVTFAAACRVCNMQTGQPFSRHTGPSTFFLGTRILLLVLI